jgi:hypothetical protein
MEGDGNYRAKEDIRLYFLFIHTSEATRKTIKPYTELN